MKKEKGKAIAFALALLCLGGGVKAIRGNVNMQYTAQAEQVASLETGAKVNLGISAKAAYLMDYATGTPMFSHNEKAHLPIASMCKIMTLILSFDAIKDGVLDMNEEITVSERAASMGGSQVFLEANAKYKVRELIKSVVVCSANDSCVALAERVAGSETAFVDRMNERAKGLGANDTLFANCTGLPKDPQYSCAYDVALMMQELLNNEEYYEFGKVWLDKFNHPEGRFTEITNTNKLVRFYDGCDGGKTGFTNQAGFCLAATAKRENMRVISVVIGGENSKKRFDDVRTTFDYAFANYTTQTVVVGGEPIEQTVNVSGGKEKCVKVYPARNAYAFTKRGEKSNITLETRFNSVKAPVSAGEEVGEILVFKDGVEMDRVPLLAQENVEKANFFDCLRDVAQGWNAR
ncbi:MAG: D-alanyl-D-alanine carboxypeptidase [Clostridiales bacterium]|nr:D-alanyl-D-alanine carboxypeptidase [Clostridiales bacterium]